MGINTNGMGGGSNSKIFAKIGWLPMPNQGPRKAVQFSRNGKNSVKALLANSDELVAQAYALHRKNVSGIKNATKGGTWQKVITSVSAARKDGTFVWIAQGGKLQEKLGDALISALHRSWNGSQAKAIAKAALEAGLGSRLRSVANHARKEWLKDAVLEVIDKV